MKKHLLLLFAALLPLVASAQTKVEIDGIWYNLVSKAKTAEATYKGNSSTSYSNEYSGSITLPATVTYNGVEYSVTSIGSSAFYECSKLTSIALPESVTSIGEGAFRDCSRLTAIIIPESVTSIGELAFRGCSSLTAIVVAEGNKVYDSRGGCNAIIESASNTLIAGCSTTILPEGVTRIGDYAFSGCSKLTSIALPESVISIGKYAFSGCSGLKSITIPEGVTSIGDDAFYKCSSLTAINIPEGVTSIGEWTFGYCSSLTDITIPESVTSIGGAAFSGCSSLTDITIPEGVTSIETSAFENCSSLKSITIPKGVTSIGYGAFVNCPELTDVYCYAERVPYYISDNTFDGSYIEYATLHVPASAINNYKTITPWSSFGTIKAIENVTLEKCATPTIGYENGKVVFTCDTEGATIKSNFIENIAGDYRKVEVACTPAYTITAYATKENYEDSDEVTLTLCWLSCEEDHEESDGIVTIPSKPVLINTQGGTITLSGLAEDTDVAVYTTGGTKVAAATATNGTATIATSLNAGITAVVKVGEHSIKVAIK